MKKLLFVFALIIATASITSADWETLTEDSGTWTGYIYNSAQKAIGIELLVEKAANFDGWTYTYKLGTDWSFAQDVATSPTAAGLTMFRYQLLEDNFTNLVNGAFSVDGNGNIAFNAPMVTSDSIFTARTNTVGSVRNGNVVTFSFNSKYAPVVGSDFAKLYLSAAFSGLAPAPMYGNTTINVPADDAVPEPMSIAFGAMGLATIAGFRRFRK